MTEPTKILVHSARQDRIQVLTLEAPPANCYSHEMMLQLDTAILAARFDTEVDVIVLRSAGERFFCAGVDISMLDEATPLWKNAFCLHANETLLRLEHTPKLVIGALQGHCVGGGLEVAMACDIRIGCCGSGKVGLPEVALGVLPGTGGTQRLARMLGKSKSIELMCEGGTFDYERALELGLINKLFEAEGYWEQVLDYARSFTLPGKASRAVGQIKRSVQTGAEIPLEQGLALERELQAGLFASEDAREGIQAYTEKRKAEFKGR